MPPSTRARDDLGVAVVLGGMVDQLLDQERAILHQAEHRAFSPRLNLQPNLAESRYWRGAAFWPTVSPMMRKRMLLLAFPAVALPGADAWAQARRNSASERQPSLAPMLLEALTDRIGLIVSIIPAGAWSALPARACRSRSVCRTAVLLVGIVVAGLAAGMAGPVLLKRVRTGVFARHAGASRRCAPSCTPPLLDFAGADGAVGARRGSSRPGRRSAGSRRASSRTRCCSALLYWRGFNFVFRVWLQPRPPEGRIAPVDDATARRLLVGMNVRDRAAAAGAGRSCMFMPAPAPRRP